MALMGEWWLEREALRQQVGENSARLAFAWGSATTTGHGQIVYDTPIDFGLAFVEKPMVSYGFELTNRSDFVDDDGDGPDRYVPISSGCVFDWIVDARGLYIGAYVAVRLVCDTTIEIEHHFGFTGLAIKDIGNGIKLDALVHDE